MCCSNMRLNMLLFHFLCLSSPVMGVWVRPPKVPDANPPKPFDNPFNPRPIVPEPADPFRPAAMPGPAQVYTIQKNIDALERKAELKEVGMVFAEELGKAILSSGTDEQPTVTNLISLTPNTTLDMKLYTPCVSYAQKLESCASSVSAFYTTTNSLAQASCACYAPMSSGSCAKSTFNTKFDDYATSCQQFMSSNGYTSVASAMDNSLLMPNLHFCQNIGAVFRTNATNSLKDTLAPTACSSATMPENTGFVNDNMVEGRSARQLTSDALREALIVSTSVCGFFWLFII